MKYRFNFLIFAAFILSLSSISYAYNYLYVLNKNQTISVCHVDQRSGDFGGCSTIYYPVGNTLVDIAVSPEGKHAYISTMEDLGNETYIGKIYVCTIEDSDGSLTGCYTDKSMSFNIPWKMTFDPVTGRLYIVNIVHAFDSNIFVCETDTDTGRYYKCNNILSIHDFVHPKSLAISANGNFAYVINSPTSSILKCQILADGTFNKDCTNFFSALYGNPFDIAISPNRNNSKAAYIIDTETVTTASSCPFVAGGSNLMNCVNDQVIPNGASATSITVSSDGRYSYTTYLGLNMVNICTMNDAGRYTNCHLTDGNNTFSRPFKAAYR